MDKPENQPEDQNARLWRQATLGAFYSVKIDADGHIVGFSVPTPQEQAGTRDRLNTIYDSAQRAQVLAATPTHNPITRAKIVERLKAANNIGKPAQWWKLMESEDGKPPPPAVGAPEPSRERYTNFTSITLENSVLGDSIPFVVEVADVLEQLAHMLRNAQTGNTPFSLLMSARGTRVVVTGVSSSDLRAQQTGATDRLTHLKE